MKRNRLLRLGAAATAAVFALTACGGNGEDTAAPAADGETDADGDDSTAGDAGGDADDDYWESVDVGEPGWPRDPVFTDPSISTLDIVYERDRFTLIYHTLPAIDRFWEDVFDEVNVLYIDDPVAPLVSGAAWLVQAEPGVVWPALEQGVVDGLIVGVTNDVEEWMLMCGGQSGVTEPEDLIGARVTGGTIGDTWNTVARIIVRDEFGLDPNDVEWITVSGGSDGRMEAALAGEVDCFMGQPRNLPPILEDGGIALFDETVSNAQTQFIVTRETWESNPDAVCAAMEGHLETVMWLEDYEEENAVDKWPEVAQHFENHGYDTEGGEQLWVSSYPGTFSRDLGASAEALDTQMNIHKGADDPAITDDFDWRNYADFSCVWKLQEAYGLDLRPEPGSF
jgi:hypothetical protein